MSDMKDNPEKLDITAQLAIAANNVRIEYCAGGVECKKCIFDQLKAAGILEPEEMPCFPAGRVINLPLLFDNTVIYLEGNELHRTTCGNRQEAEKLLQKLKRDNR